MPHQAARADLAITARPPHLPTLVLRMPGEARLAVARQGAGLRVTVPQLQHHLAVCFRGTLARS